MFFQKYLPNTATEIERSAIKVLRYLEIDYNALPKTSLGRLPKIIKEVEALDNRSTDLKNSGSKESVEIHVGWEVAMRFLYHEFDIAISSFALEFGKNYTFKSSKNQDKQSFTDLKLERYAVTDTFKDQLRMKISQKLPSY